MRTLKSRIRKFWYIGIGAALALAPALTAFADGGSGSDSQ